MTSEESVISSATSILKKKLRAEKNKARNELSSEQRRKLSFLVCSYASEWLELNTTASLMAYVSFRSELDTHSLITEAWKAGRSVLLPRVISASREMSVHKVNAWNELEPSAYGILEPNAMVREVGDEILPEVVFVPGLAFDDQCGRLGYGGGYYDRLLASWKSKENATVKPPVWIGLAYGMQLTPKVPMDEHDAFMDMLITENGIMHCRKGV